MLASVAQGCLGAIFFTRNTLSWGRAVLRMHAIRNGIPPGGAARAQTGDAPGRLSAVGSMDDVTRILSAVAQGDARAAEQLLPLVYDELRKLAAQRLAREKPGQTLEATALVHEAYLRLVGPQDPGWDGRGHFFAAAAEAMRRILVERARRKRTRKHGGDLAPGSGPG